MLKNVWKFFGVECIQRTERCTACWSS